MNLLIDSHILLWALQEPQKIDEKVRSIMQNSQKRYLSLASLWELSIKYHKGKLDFSTKDLLGAAENLDFTILPILPDHILALENTGIKHKDPFDNMLVAQAKVEGLSFITADRDILKLNLPFVIAGSK